MKPRYSKRVREEAALICAIAASRADDETLWSFANVGEAAGACEAAIGLAWEMWMSLAVVYDQKCLERDAEAAQLLLEGAMPWSPL